MIMARKGIKFSKAHRANLRAAHAKRRKPIIPIASEFAKTVAEDMKIGSTLRIRLPNDYVATSHSFSKANGLIDRMTQAIDKIENQIKRLETL